MLLCLLVIFFCSHHTSLHSICVAFANLIMQCRMNSCIKLQYPDFISAEHVHFLFQQAAALLHTSCQLGFKISSWVYKNLQIWLPLAANFLALWVWCKWKLFGMTKIWKVEWIYPLLQHPDFKSKEHVHFIFQQASFIYLILSQSLFRDYQNNLVCPWILTNLIFQKTRIINHKTQQTSILLG